MGETSKSPRSQGRFVYIPVKGFNVHIIKLITHEAIHGGSLWTGWWSDIKSRLKKSLWRLIYYFRTEIEIIPVCS
jgi:hypothetical protein